MIEKVDEIFGIIENHRYTCITLLFPINQKLYGSKVLLLALQVSSK